MTLRYFVPISMAFSGLSRIQPMPDAMQPLKSSMTFAFAFAHGPAATQNASCESVSTSV